MEGADAGSEDTDVFADAPLAMDTTAPTVQIVSPSVDGESFSGVISISVDASDDFAIERVELEIGDLPLATLAKAPYAAQWNAGGFEPGCDGEPTRRSGEEPRRKDLHRHHIG